MADYQSLGKSGSKQKVRLPLLTSAHIDSFTGATVNNEAGRIYNGIVDKYTSESDRPYVTQRPHISMFIDASATVGVGTKGRGVYFWAINAKRYIVNDDTVYQDDYTTALTVYDPGAGGAGLTSGTEKVYFAEFATANATYLFIINPEGNQVFVISSAADTVLINLQDIWTQVGDTGTGAPFHASDSWDLKGLPNLTGNDQDASHVGLGFTLCHGAVVLDQYLFLGTKEAQIFNSNVGDFLAWDPLGTITCEREEDQLLYIDKSKDHVLGFGERTLEIFYDAANAAPASPLSPRADIFYNKGIISGETAWRNGDEIYFLGLDPAGDFHFNIFREYQIEDVSPSTLDSYLKQGRTEAALTPKVVGLSTGHHTYIVLTLYDDSDPPVPQISWVYDNENNYWYEWETNLLGNIRFALQGWTIRTPETPVVAEGILSSGDLVKVVDNFQPIDTSADLGYFAEDYEFDTSAAGGYDAFGAPETSNINMKILISNFDADSTDRKFMHCLKYVGNRTDNSQILFVRWNDDSRMSTAWTAQEQIDLSTRTQINRLGSFERRAFEVEYSGNEQIRIEALESDLTVGTK